MRQGRQRRQRAVCRHPRERRVDALADQGLAVGPRPERRAVRDRAAARVDRDVRPGGTVRRDREASERPRLALDPERAHGRQLGLQRTGAGARVLGEPAGAARPRAGRPVRPPRRPGRPAPPGPRDLSPTRRAPGSSRRSPTGERHSVMALSRVGTRAQAVPAAASSRATRPGRRDPRPALAAVVGGPQPAAEQPAVLGAAEPHAGGGVGVRPVHRAAGVVRDGESGEGPAAVVGLGQAHAVRWRAGAGVAELAEDDERAGARRR